MRCSCSVLACNFPPPQLELFVFAFVFTFVCGGSHDFIYIYNEWGASSYKVASRNTSTQEPN